MNETELRGWMRVLPRAKASPAFTSDVMRNIRREKGTRRIPFGWRLAAGFAMVVCIVAIVQVAALQNERRVRMAEMRAEQQKIEAELQEVKEIASGAEPVFVLENEQGTRVIMDLDSAIQPASLKTYD
jgi:cytochrome c-type biogenesis protein CcmH/NrfG